MDDLAGLGKAMEGLAKIAEVVAKAVEPFTNPVLRSAGQYLAHRVEGADVLQVLKMTQRAREIMAREGIPVGSVPLKILTPILEGAAIEEPELLERWSNLLARASAGERVHPSYASILMQLTPQDVAFLDWLDRTPPREESPVCTIYPTVGDARRSLGWDVEQTLLVLDILRRERLVELSGTLSDPVRPRDYDPVDGTMLSLTMLGSEFIEACTIPPDRPAESQSHAVSG